MSENGDTPTPEEAVRQQDDERRFLSTSIEEHQGDVTITMRRWVDVESGETDDTALVLTPDEALAWAERLTQAARHGYNHRIRQMVLGDCERCQNLRMIDVERKRGGSEQVHCPDCSVPRGGEVVEVPSLPWQHHTVRV